MSHEAIETDGYGFHSADEREASGLPASDCSRLSDTPETDAAAKTYFDDPFGDRAESDLLDFTRSLERERDQARAEAMKWRERWAEDTPLEEIGCTLPPWMRKSPENVRGQSPR